jgi:hypothetical protein
LESLLKTMPTVPVNRVLKTISLYFAFYAVERVADEPKNYSGNTACENVY